MHAGQHGLIGRPLAAHQRQVQGLAGLVTERMRGELAKGGVERAGAEFFNQGFGAAAVFNQVGNGADLQTVLGGKDLQIG